MTALEALQKEKAAELLGLLTHDSITKKFIEEGSIYLFENERYQAVELSEDNPVYIKLREFERERNCKVYAVTHEFFSFGECYSFLYVPKYMEDWEYLIRPMQDSLYYVQAYVWNKTDEYRSESGGVVIHSDGLILCRVG